jgi:hypothetical protein
MSIASGEYYYLCSGCDRKRKEKEAEPEKRRSWGDIT